MHENRIFDSEKAALSEEELGQATGGVFLDPLIAMSGRGKTAVTMEQRSIPGTGMPAAVTLRGGKLCPKCGAPLDGPSCTRCPWTALSTGSVSL